MRALNILFVLENYLPHIGGVEIVFKNLCEGLVKRGHKVTIITRQLPATTREERIGGVRVIRVPVKNRYHFSFSPTVQQTILRYAKEADIIHTTTFNAAPQASLASFLQQRPVLITVHETWLGKWRQYSAFHALKADLHELLESSVFALPYARYVCVSESTARQLREARPSLRKKITTIHNGFDPAPWKKDIPTKTLDALRRKLKLGGKFVIFAYGRPGTSKGFPYLIKAFDEIKKDIPNAALVLMLSKDKQYAQEIEKMKRSASKGVVFIESKPYKEIPSYAKMADCIVVPSITEGFGYTTLEACASGTPLVASDTTSIPEVIWGKHVLVKPADPHAIAQGVLKVRRGKYNITPEKKFPWSKTITLYEREYAAMLRAKAKRKR